MWNMKKTKALYEIFLKIMSGKHLYFLQRLSCDLDLWPWEPKINKVLVLTKTNQHVTYESSVISFQDSDRKPFVSPMDGQTDGQTDGWTDRPTDQPTNRPILARQYAPSSSKGGINICFFILTYLVLRSRPLHTF